MSEEQPSARQQFIIPAKAEEDILKLADKLGMKPNALKAQALTTLARMESPDIFYIAQGRIHELINKKG